MSIENLLKILARAIDARDKHDAATRQNVYAISRATLERFLEQSADLDEDKRAAQRRELEFAIEKLESRLVAAEAAALERLATPAPVAPSGGAASVERSKTATGRAEEVSKPPMIDPRRDVQPQVQMAQAVPVAPTPPPSPAVPDPKPARIAEPAGTRPPPPEPAPPPPPPAAPRPPAAPVAKADAPAAKAAPPAETPAAHVTPPGPEAESPGRDAAPLDIETAPATTERPTIFAEGEPPQRSEPERGEIDEKEVRRHNRRGAIALIVLLVVFVGAYETDLGDGIRHWLAGGAPAEPLAVIERTAVVEGAPPVTVAAARSRSIRQLANGATSVDLRIEGIPAEAANFTGRMVWTRTDNPSGKAATSAGRATLDGSPFVADAVIEPDVDAPDPRSRMLAIGWSGLTEDVSGSPAVRRIDPTNGTAREVDGVMVRVGGDRVLFGYTAEAADAAVDFDRRSRFEIDFPLESGKHLILLFGLPNPS